MFFSLQTKKNEQESQAQQDFTAAMGKSNDFLPVPPHHSETSARSLHQQQLPPQQQQQQLFHTTPAGHHQPFFPTPHQYESQSSHHSHPPPLETMRPPLEMMQVSGGPVAAGPIKQLHKLLQHHNIDYEKGGGPSSTYRDLSIYPDPEPDNRRNRGGVTVPFPEKLHQMLEYAEKNGLTDIVSFFSHGRAFAIHKPITFVKDLMPQFFKQSRFTSFQRQVNLYGFKRISQGPDSGGYYHELFLKGRPGLCINMKRTKVKGLTKGKHESDYEPNFYKMPPITKNSDATARMDRLLPSLAVKTTMPPPSNSLGISAPSSLNSFGASMPGGGSDRSKQGKPFKNAQFDRFSNVNDAGPGLTNPSGVMPTSLDMGLLDPNNYYGHRSFANNPNSSMVGMYPQGGSTQFNYANTMTSSDFQNNQHLDHFSSMAFRNKMPQMAGNTAANFSTLQNAASMPTDQSINLPQNLKRTDNARSAMTSLLGSSNDGSFGLSYNPLALHSSLSGQSSGPFGISTNPYTGISPAASTLQAMTANAMQGKDQLSMSNLHQNLDPTAALNQRISPTHPFLGHQQENYGVRPDAAMGMKTSDFTRTAYLGGDTMSSFNVGQMMSQTNASIPSIPQIQSNAPFSLPESGMNNSMLGTMAAYGSNYSADAMNDPRNLHQIQQSKEGHAMAMNQQSHGMITKNDSKSSDGQSFQNPFESDASDGNKDAKKDDDQITGVTKV